MTVFDIAVFVPDKSPTMIRHVNEIMKNFADALYESTNGAHFLGNVTLVFDTTLVLRGQVDVVIMDAVHPNGALNGFQESGLSATGAAYIKISLRNIWSDGMPMNSASIAGATLAHEWGHYAYGLLDEYYYAQVGDQKIFYDSDTLQTPSLMMDNNKDSLVHWNFSSRWTAFQNPLGTPLPNSIDVDGNVVVRLFTNGYATSAWDFLTRDSVGWINKSSKIEYSHYYADLAKPGVAPSIADSAMVRFLGDSVKIGGIRVEYENAEKYSKGNSAYLGSRDFYNLGIGMDSLMEPMHALLFDGASMDAALRNRAAFLASLMNLANHLPDTARFKHRLAVYALRKDNADLGLYTLQEPVPFNDAADYLDDPSTYENYNANWNTKVANVSEALWEILRRIKKDELAKIWAASHEAAVDGIPWRAGRATRLVVLTAGGAVEGLDSLRWALRNYNVELDVVAVDTNSQALQDWRVLGQELGVFMNLGDLDFSTASWQTLYGFKRWESLGAIKAEIPGGNTKALKGENELKPFLQSNEFSYRRLVLAFSDSSLSQRRFFLNKQEVDASIFCDTSRLEKSIAFSCWIKKDGQIHFDSLWVNDTGSKPYTIARLNTDNNEPGYMGGGFLVVGGSESGMLSIGSGFRRGASYAPVPGFSVAGLTVWAYVVDAAGVIQDTLVLNDMGNAGDAFAHDGVYSGLSAKNLAVGDYNVYLDFSGDSTLQATEVLSSNSYSGIRSVVPRKRIVVLDSLKQSTSAGYLRVDPSALDEADWCSASSDTLSAAQRRLAGRMDYAQDQDCFVLKGDGRPRVLRLGELLGPEPDISWRDAQGNELLDSSLLPLQSAMGYRYWQLSPWLLSKGLQVVVRAADSLTKAGSYTIVLDTATIADKSRFIASLQSADFAGTGANYTGLAVKVRNQSGDTLRDFRIRYYFNTEYFAEPQVSDWWSAFCSAKRVRLGPELWAVELDYAGTALAPGASLQIDPDNAIGVHYGDWRSWNTANDWSWRPGFGFQENPRLVLLNSAGTVLQGELPSDSLYAGRARIQSVVPHVREEQSAGANWSAPRIQLENVGDSVANPQVFYYFHEQGELSLPVAWQCTHCTVRLDSLGGGDWRLVLDYAGYTLPANNSMWEAEAYIGLRHTDWSPWNHADDVPRTEVRNAQGELLGSQGGTP